MKRNAGAQGGEGKLESRFAALTSGLLARKGHAAPSNSPIHDPAEETDAFALEPTRKSPAAGLKPPPKAAPAPAPKAAEKPAAPAAKKSPAEPAPAPAAKKAAEPASKKTAGDEIKLGKTDRADPAPMTIINERSFEAGYPDNPTPEEIAALEAEADEVVSYFENFGADDALALEKEDFFGDEEELEDLEDEDDAPPAAIAGPWGAGAPGSSVPSVGPKTAFDVKAAVTVELNAREFMRLSLGAAELGQSAQEMISEAIEDYLDARGVLSLGGCACLETVMKAKAGG